MHGRTEQSSTGNAAIHALTADTFSFDERFEQERVVRVAEQNLLQNLLRNLLQNLLRVVGQV